jgi:hypothetical protein
VSTIGRGYDEMGTKKKGVSREAKEAQTWDLSDGVKVFREYGQSLLMKSGRSIEMSVTFALMIVAVFNPNSTSSTPGYIIRFKSTSSYLT